MEPREFPTKRKGRGGTRVGNDKAADVCVTVVSRTGNGAIRFGTEMTNGIERFVHFVH